MSTAPTAAVLIIGNEILSGRTADVNLHFLAAELNSLGIRLKEARVAPDQEAEIVEAVNALRERYDYVFTTGGIGPTHDDITTAAIAKAFDVPVIRHAEAARLLTAKYGNRLNAARLKMADVPEGAELLSNPVSAAPGFRRENVYVLAGVPEICRGMFGALKSSLRKGTPILSRTFSTQVAESVFAEELAAIAKAHPEVEIGSYPFHEHGKWGVNLVAQGTNETAIKTVESKLQILLDKYRNS